MKVRVIIERGKDGFYSFYMDNDSFDFGLNGQGNSVEEAKKEFLTTYEELKEMKAEEGAEIPNLEFEYEYDMASFLDYYSEVLGKAALERITGVNQKLLFHYSSGLKKPRKETVLKIKEALYKFAKDLEQVRFVD